MRCDAMRCVCVLFIAEWCHNRGGSDRIGSTWHDMTWHDMTTPPHPNTITNRNFCTKMMPENIEVCLPIFDDRSIDWLIHSIIQSHHFVVFCCVRSHASTHKQIQHTVQYCTACDDNNNNVLQWSVLCDTAAAAGHQLCPIEMCSVLRLIYEPLLKKKVHTVYYCTFHVRKN